MINLIFFSSPNKISESIDKIFEKSLTINGCIPLSINSFSSSLSYNFFNFSLNKSSS